MSGLKIIKATYGYGLNTVDVTPTVNSYINGGILNVKVNSDLLKQANIPDPAPNEKKTLTITYTINDGEVNTKQANEGNVINIVAPATSSEGLVILKAQYGKGAENGYVDVTNAVKSLVKNGSIHLKVTPENLGITYNKPTNGSPPDLVVEYTINGSLNTASIPDGETFSLSAPPQSGSTIASSSTSYNVTGDVFTFLTSMFGSVLYSFGTWLCAFAWYDLFSMNYGQTISYIAFVFGFLSSYPGLFLLMIFIFFRRVFMTTDLKFIMEPLAINTSI